MPADNPFRSRFKKALKGLKIILILQAGFTVLEIVIGVTSGLDGSAYGALAFLFIAFVWFDLLYLLVAALVCFAGALRQGRPGGGEAGS